MKKSWETDTTIPLQEGIMRKLIARIEENLTKTRIYRGTSDEQILARLKVWAANSNLKKVINALENL